MIFWYQLVKAYFTPVEVLMDPKERAELIRKGNEMFNNGDIAGATNIFVQTGYGDGLTRLADFYYYDRREPLVALKFYRMVNCQEKINEIFERVVYALGRMMGGKPAEPKVELPPLKVSPKLKILAEEILREEENKEK